MQDNGNENNVETPSLVGAGDLTIDVGRREVRRNGTIIELPKLSFQLLQVLVDAAPNVLTMDDLIDRVWAGKIVSPETVTQRVKLLRGALGDDAQSPKYIGLVRGQGYRFLAEVRPISDETITQSLVTELSQRRVFQVAVMYIAVAWSLTEAATFVVSELPIFPDATNEIMAILFVVGFPVAMFLAWQFDVDRRGGLRMVAASTRGKATILGAIVLLGSSTWGLYYVIDPSAQLVEEPSTTSPLAVNAVAVLPFTNASGDNSDLYISDGLGDELRDQLGRIGGLQVVSRSSSMVFRDQPVAAKDIAQQLGVRWLIESTFRKQGDRLRVSVQIIDGESGFQTWSQSFDRLVSDLLGAQQDIAMQVVSEILPTARDQVADANLGSRNISAHTLMLLARHLEQQVRDDSLVDETTLDRAIELYNEAVEVDPGNALAQARLAGALLYKGDLEAAHTPIFRALELNPKLADAHYSLGLYHWRRGESAGGDAYKKAVELNPNHTDAIAAYAKWLWHNEVVDETGELFRQALALDPLSLQRYSDLGNYYGIVGDRDAAIEIAEQVQELFPNVPGYRLLGRIYELVGDFDTAITWVRKAKSAQPELEDINWQLSELYARIGDDEMADTFDSDASISKLFFGRRYGELVDVAEELIFENPGDIKIYYALAFAYNTQGYYTEALRLLQVVGLPDRWISDSRTADAQEAMFTYVGALQEMGQSEDAEVLAEGLRARLQAHWDSGGQDSGWVNLFLSCALGYLGEESLMYEHLETIPNTPGLVWYPILKDQRCFQPYIANPRYLDVVALVEEKMADQRDRARVALEEAAPPPLSQTGQD